MTSFSQIGALAVEDYNSPTWRQWRENIENGNTKADPNSIPREELELVLKYATKCPFFNSLVLYALACIMGRNFNYVRMIWNFTQVFMTPFLFVNIAHFSLSLQRPKSWSLIPPPISGGYTEDSPIELDDDNTATKTVDQWTKELFAVLSRLPRGLLADVSKYVDVNAAFLEKSPLR